MRVQYSMTENEIINKRRDEHKNFDGIMVPVEGQGQIITLGMLITDVHRFNMFITKWIEDQSNENSDIAREIGADIVHIDYRAPIKSDQLLFLKNYIEEILYGPIPNPAPEEGEQQVLLEEGDSIELVSPQTESGLIVDDSVSPITKEN